MKLEKITKSISGLDEGAMKAAKARQDSLTKPLGSLGILEDLSIKVAGITGNSMPRIVDKVVVTMAGDHGVVEEGVSGYPQEVTLQMVYNFMRGGAGINVLARHVGARVVVVDMGVKADLGGVTGLVIKHIGYGTKNITKGPAMRREQALEAIEAGIEVFEAELEKGMDIVGIGDMGIGNTTASSAIVAAITGKAVEEVTGRGTGINEGMFENKIRVIGKALAINSPDGEDGIDVLCKVGGFEIGGLVGLILAGAGHRVPVVMDGFIVGAAALIAIRIAPAAKDFIIAAHRSAEPGHKVILEWLGVRPLLELDLRLGEGTGAALGISLVEAACKILVEMATFEEARVFQAI